MERFTANGESSRKYAPPEAKAMIPTRAKKRELSDSSPTKNSENKNPSAAPSNTVTQAHSDGE